MTQKLLYLIAVIFCLFFEGVTLAQVSLATDPVSWNLPDDLSETLSFLELSDVDVEELLLEDALAVDEKDIPIRFAVKQNVDLNSDVNGRWTNLPNGDRIWMLGINSPEAKALSVTFETFDIPKGAVLHLYNRDRSFVLGAFTDENNKTDGTLSTSAIPGEELIIEYYEPYAVRQEGYFSIRTIAHSYRNVDSQLNDMLPAISCNLNVSCYNEESYSDPAAATVMITVDDGTRWCTGTLLNNANFDGTPYVITSANCLYGDPSSWLFTFRYQSAECAPSLAGKYSHSVSGAKVLTTSEEAAITLLELSTRPRPEWEVFYAGWDASGATPQSLFSVHHPMGDVQKVSESDEAPSVGIWKGTDVFTINDWTLGSTSNGSTGAPLFDNHSRLAGVLYGGNSNCQNGEADHYAKLVNAWDDFEKYLNPFNQDIVTLDGTYLRFGEVDNRIFQSNVAIFPNPANASFNIINDTDEAIRVIRFYDMTGRVISEESYVGQNIPIDHLPVGNYIIEILLESEILRQQLLIYR